MKPGRINLTVLFLVLLTFVLGCKRQAHLTAYDIGQISTSNIQDLVPVVEIIGRSDTDAEILLAAGNKLLEYKNPMEASKAFHKTLKNYPNNSEAKVGLIKSKIALYNIDSAKFYLDSFKDLPQQEMKNLAFTLHQLEVLDSIDQELGSKPTINLLSQRAKLLYQMGKYTAAAQDYSHLFDSTYTTYFAKEACLSFISAYEFKEALKIINKTRPFLKLEEEKKFFLISDTIIKSSELIWKQIKENPNPNGYINLAKNFSRINLFHVAHLSLDQGERLFKNNPNLLYARAIVFIMEGNKDSALHYLKEAQKNGININPNLVKQFN